MARTIKVLMAMAIAIIMPTKTACSSDDEPKNAKSGAENAEFIKSQVLDENGAIDFLEGKTPGEYLMPTDDKELADGLCKTLTLNNWSGKATTADLGDGYGTIRVTPGADEGIYSTLVFNVKGINPFTLHITTIEYYKDNNSTVARPPLVRTYYVCTKCGAIYYHRVTSCTCGGTNFRTNTDILY